MDFNAPAQLASFRYERNPLAERGFIILKRNERNEYDPVGDYMVLNEEEDFSLSEKKVMNIVSLLDGQDDRVLALGEETGTQAHFHIKPSKTKNEQTQVVFYELGTQGTSKENALLTIDEESIL